MEVIALAVVFCLFLGVAMLPFFVVAAELSKPPKRHGCGMVE